MSQNIDPPHATDASTDTPEVNDTPEVDASTDPPEVGRTPIETRLVYGFLDAGKTHYIRDCILNDYFHKYGTTLILCFEQGEESYDPEALSSRKTTTAYYDGDKDVAEFCRCQIEQTRPDRIYVEMNAMMQGLRDKFPACMKVTFSITLIDWATLHLYFTNFKQLMNQMVAASQQVTFRGCPSKDSLAQYSQPFRLMNPTATYLRQDPMGYHERAFDRFLPFSLEDEVITITEKDYIPFWLDALENPEHYEGKTLCFRDPLELRRSTETSPWYAGRVVMVCCMADLQFMSFELDLEPESEPDGTLKVTPTGDTDSPPDSDSKVIRESALKDAPHHMINAGGWVTFDALALLGTDEYGRKHLKLRPGRILRAAPPEHLIMNSNSVQ